MTDTSMRDPFAFARGGELLALIAEERRLEEAAEAAYRDDDVQRADDLMDHCIRVQCRLRDWRPKSLSEVVALIDYWQRPNTASQPIRIARERRRTTSSRFARLGCRLAPSSWL